MQMENIDIRIAKSEDLKNLDAFVVTLGNGKANDYFIANYERQMQGERLIVVAYDGAALICYCVLNWTPKYAFYRAMGYPEIQDLNVAKTHRKRGVASAVIKYCEKLARDQGREFIGISVGLTSAYGPAQKLYYKLGYVPDGHGVTYDRKNVSHGEFRPIDDDLCLMMIKPL